MARCRLGGERLTADCAAKATMVHCGCNSGGSGRKCLNGVWCPVPIMGSMVCRVLSVEGADPEGRILARITKILLAAERGLRHNLRPTRGGRAGPPGCGPCSVRDGLLGWKAKRSFPPAGARRPGRDAYRSEALARLPGGAVRYQAARNRRGMTVEQSNTI